MLRWTRGCSDHDSQTSKNWNRRPGGIGQNRPGRGAVHPFSRQQNIAVITNDIYTREDAEFLVRRQALPPERIVGVETGGCPHTAIREDASVNLEACALLQRRFPDLDLLLIESGGDNLAATFSPELVDATIYVIDVAEGDKIPRKGGPGITNSDSGHQQDRPGSLCGASLEVMERDTTRIRGGKPHVFTNLKDGTGIDTVADWIRRTLLFES